MNVWDGGSVTKVTSFVRKHKVSYPVLFDTGEKMFQAYTSPDKPRGVPTNAVIDRSGKISYIGAGFDEKALIDAVDKALK
jgi:peroxiredoxin